MIISYCAILGIDVSSFTKNVQEEMEKQMKQSLKDKVLSVHKYAMPDKERYKEGRQRTKVIDKTVSGGRKTIWAASEDEMYLKLYDFYFSNNKKTVHDIWNMAILKERQESTKSEKTFYNLEKDFNRYISRDFASKNIDEITLSDLKAYCKKIVSNKTQLKESSFKAFKCILNIIFIYAQEYGYIQSNPVLGIKNSEYLKMCASSVRHAEEKALSVEDVLRIKNNIYSRMNDNRYHGYYIYGYMILLSIETGMRAGELCSLKWNDITDDIWIHTQQLELKNPLSYYEVNWTKNEKKHEGYGRHFPLTDEIINILESLKSLQQKHNIHSEYVFCNQNGKWITTRHYAGALGTVCKCLNLPKTNNHAIRMYFNSYVLIPAGIPVTDRAALLGHSVETNLKRYSFENVDYVNNAKFIINNFSPQMSPTKKALNSYESKA